MVAMVRATAERRRKRPSQHCLCLSYIDIISDFIIHKQYNTTVKSEYISSKKSHKKRKLLSTSQ